MFLLFDKESSSSDVEDILYYINSIIVLEKEVRRDIGLSSICENMKKEMQFVVSSIFKYISLTD